MGRSVRQLPVLFALLEAGSTDVALGIAILPFSFYQIKSFLNCFGILFTNRSGKARFY
jgi:hypothetical protein